MMMMMTTRVGNPVLLALLLASTATFAYTPQAQPQRSRTTIPSTAQKAVAIPLPEVQQVTAADRPTKPRAILDPEDQWVANLDYENFGKEVAALGRELLRIGGNDDVRHLNKIVSWRDAAAVLGIATMSLAPFNPIAIAALSTWTYASWTMIGHHTCHGGYNRVDAGRFNSRGFAIGSVQNRIRDFCDWMLVDAWNIEHNRLHHYRLNEQSDPDLVQRNLGFLRNGDAPMIVRYGVVGFFMLFWKAFYYAPNTYKELQIAKWKQEGKALPKDFDPEVAATLATLLLPGKQEDALRQVTPLRDVLIHVLGPFFVTRFALLPLPFLLIPGVGSTLYVNALINIVAAELLTNLHAFITIVTNHAGDDLYTFKDAVKPKSSSFYVRQVVGSANYATGDDITDFSHGFLNYQIEHHVWPDLSMRQYQIGAPKLKAICEKYGVPYVQESVWTRLRKTVDIMVGKTTMRIFPTEYEPTKDKAATVTWKSTNGAIDEDDE